MSPVILTEDVLFHVVSHLDAIHSRSARRTLARLAQAHSTLKKPALAVLWRSLPSTEALEHLLCVIGIAQEDVQHDHQGLTHLGLHGTLETHRLGWERFQEYSVLVREITLDPFFRAAQHPLGFGLSLILFDPEDTFWGNLTSAFGAEHILPCLRMVTLCSSDSVRFSTFNPDTLRFLSPSVREFNVDVASVSPEGRWKFAQFFAMCFSSVKDLNAISLETLVPVLDFESLPQLHSRLRRLTVRSIEPDGLSHVSSLQNLEHLWIGLTPEVKTPDLPIKFLQLRNLTLSSYRSSAMSAFVANVDIPQLQSFSGSMLQSSCRDPKEMYEELSNVVSLLVAKCPALISFSWMSDRWAHNDGPSCAANALQLAKLVAPLLSVRTVHNFSASFKRHMISCTPSDFRVFAQAWPELETLALRIAANEHEADEDEADEDEVDEDKVDEREADENENAYADFESLVSFARHCPRLRRLHLPTVMFDHTADTTAIVRPPAPHWLQRLYVETVVLSAEQSVDEASESFLGLMREVFPEADIDFGF